MQRHFQRKTGGDKTKKDLKIIQTLNNEVFIHDKNCDENLNVDWPFPEEGINYYKKNWKKLLQCSMSQHQQ
jgi:hypothetical protein